MSRYYPNKNLHTATAPLVGMLAVSITEKLTHHANPLPLRKPWCVLVVISLCTLV